MEETDFVDFETEQAPEIRTSAQQDEAIEAAIDWFEMGRETRRPMFKLFGYAGTGKTTIAKMIARRFRGNVHFAAYTGKAASVLRAKGCTGAGTIHGLIYRPRNQNTQVEKKDADGAVVGTVTVKELKFDLHGAALQDPRSRDLVIIDECSMVGEKVGQDLLSFRKPILVLGDPAQLPPVGDGGFFTNGEPDVMLTEIHRQKEGCGILDIATAVRTGAGLRVGTYEESHVLPRSAMWSIDPLEFDQVICGTNATRRAWNRRIRLRLGRDSRHPVPGDRLICLRNNHRLGLMNGEQVDVLEIRKQPTERSKILDMIVDRDGQAMNVKAPTHYFDEEQGDPEWSGDEFVFFDFGYAITCHKSQGSQWPRVMVINESRVFRHDADRWLYTAVTRASSMVTVVG